MPGPTYDEARMWVYWLGAHDGLFSATELADSMAVTVESAAGFVIGLKRAGTIRDTGMRINGSGPPEPLYELVPLPPGPTEHPTHLAPENDGRLGCYVEAPRRGMPVPGTTSHGTKRTRKRNKSVVGGGLRAGWR